MNIMTPRQYVLNSVLNYPSMYSHPTYDDCARKAFDHLFNVVGNGYSDHDELMEMLTAPIPDNLEELAAKYITSELVYYGYEQVKELGNSGQLLPCASSDEIIALESERPLFINVKLWVPCGQYPFNPYPNFDDKYSLVYRTDILKLSADWRDAARWFYVECEKYFNSDRVSGYHGYYGGTDSREDQKLLQLYRKGIERNFANGTYKTNADVSRAYQLEVEFDGDYDKFVKARWAKQLAEIKTFIAKTIAMIEAY